MTPGRRLMDENPSTAKIRKLVTDWIEVGGDVDAESFDRWLEGERAKAVEERVSRMKLETHAVTDVGRPLFKHEADTLHSLGMRVVQRRVGEWEPYTP